VNVAPIIPGLNDGDVPKVLEAAREAGARTAWYVMLRLPHTVKEVFEERLRAAYPDRADHVLALVRDVRGGELYDARYGVRGRGTGQYADTVRALFDATTRRLGFETSMGLPRERTFRRPPRRGSQLPLL
jgi:DNA repair photolyase